MRKSQIKMPTKAEILIKKSTALLYLSFVVAAIQAVRFGFRESDFLIEIIATFIFLELALLILTLIPGLKNKLTRIFLLVLILIELILFFLDQPIELNELLLVLILLIRIYVLILLFNTTASKFYAARN